MALEKNRLKMGCLLYDTGGVCVAARAFNITYLRDILVVVLRIVCTPLYMYNFHPAWTLVGYI